MLSALKLISRLSSYKKTWNTEISSIRSYMNCIYLLEARYIKDFKIFLKFNTEESGEVDLKDTIYKYKIATPLRDSIAFSKFYLDSWPTLAWNCGFDIAPESLYFMVSRQKFFKEKTLASNGKIEMETTAAREINSR